jgi:hypothetical protein
MISSFLDLGGKGNKKRSPKENPDFLNDHFQSYSVGRYAQQGITL